MATHGDQCPRQTDRTRHGVGLLLVLSCFISLKKKKKKKAEAKIAKCQHLSNLYGKYTEDLLLAVLLCTLEIFHVFLKRESVAVILSQQLAGALEREGCRNAVTKAGVGQAGRAGLGGWGVGKLPLRPSRDGPSVSINRALEEEGGAGGCRGAGVGGRWGRVDINPLPGTLPPAVDSPDPLQEPWA